MENLFVPYELAIKLEAKDFRKECLGHYGHGYVVNTYHNGLLYFGEMTEDGDLRAPLYQQVILWLLKKLEFGYPCLRFELYADCSGAWIQSRDDYTGNPEVDITFNDLNEAIDEGLKLLK